MLIKKSLKAQVTIFIIVALLIIVGIVIFFVIRSGTELDFGFKDKNLVKDVYDLDPEYWPLYNLVESCIIDTGYEAVEHIGSNGGYLKPVNSFNLEQINLSIPYYFDQGDNYMPSKERIENEISIYINENLKSCTFNFIGFDYEIKEGKVDTRTEIFDDDIVFNVEYPIHVSDVNYNFTLRDFSIPIPVRLGIVYDVIATFMKNQIDYGNEICRDCFEGLIQNNLTVNSIITNTGKTSILFVKDKKSQIKGEDFTFIFANRYS